MADRQEIADAARKAKEIGVFRKDATLRLDGAAKTFAGKRAAIAGQAALHRPGLELVWIDG
ncbi:MAG TPA: hypothetical protein VL202_11330 [Pararhizobium sp.]|uniref:hypothetical protein n=1 Tax=Pararhizobium sp. TaxID=1977563 RepID=UPI002BB8C9CB|nr:hypothetical protein [Pararhizobium sp.]HTO31754.1 hypothetical protein [Pararhizobium sp.]